MKKEKIQEIAKKIVNGLDEGINFLSWQDIVSYVREDSDSATIALYADRVISEIQTLCRKQGIAYYFPNEIYLYHGEYKRAERDGLTMIKFFRPDLERVDEIKTDEAVISKDLSKIKKGGDKNDRV
jgi:hypothetical protein